ncbi:MAG: hypothetical protein M9894_23345 [Planctomycetes bacterium]|nr:hypothetical protein [Planctomycetota bacterium]
MSDPTLRGLERALAAGDRSARVPLAAAYVRQGRAGEALALLDEPGVLPPEAAAVHEAAWRRELATLEPAGEALGDASAEDALVGWFGPGGRWAALGGPRRLRVLDLERGALVPPGALPLAATPVATSREHLYCRAAGEVLQVTPPRGEHEPWRWTGLWMAPGEPPFEPSPDGAQVLVRLPDQALLVAWPDGDVLRSVPPACDVAWEAGRVAWWVQGKVVLAGLDRGAPPQVLDLLRDVLGRAPLLGRELPAAPGQRPRLFRFLADGRLLLGPPLLVVDPATGAYAAPVEGRDADLEGPARLSRDGAAVLAFRRGLPVRVPLEGGEARRPSSRSGGGAGAWHPRADLAATGPLDRGQPELRAADGETVRALPRDARPLGWTPDGRGLLVHRARGPGGALELWRTASATAAAGRVA